MANQSSKRTRARAEEEQLEKSYRNISSSKRRSNRSSGGQRKMAVIAICVAILAVAIGIFAGCIYLSSGEEDGLILQNVTIAGVDVGGMTKEQAVNAVTLATQNTFSQKNMVVQVLDHQTELTPAATGAALNVEAAVEAAYAYGRTGSASQQQKEQAIAMTSGYALDIIPYLNLDTEAVREAVDALGANYSSTLSQTSYEITGQVPSLDLSEDASAGQTLVITVGTPEHILDLDALYDQVLAAYNANTFYVEGDCEIVVPNALDLEKIYSEHYIAPVDASIDTNTFEVKGGSYGYGFDKDAVTAALETAEYGEVLEFSFMRIAPEVTSDSLSTLLYRDVLGSFTSSSESEENRNTNLRVACSSIDGLIIYPGEVFSYNDALGERTAANGYKPGPSYAGNETVMTYGGGICQVSSALYYCTLVADLEIVARENHGFFPGYVPLGMDATVSWGSLDFMFRNNTNYPIRIEASASGGEVTVKLVGTDEKDYYVKMEYIVRDTFNYSTTYQIMSSDNSQGYKDGDVIIDPYTGYNVDTYRCKYNKATNELIEKVHEDYSDYRKRDEVICKIKDPVIPPADPTDTTDPSNPSEPVIDGSVSDGSGAQLPPE